MSGNPNAIGRRLGKQFMLRVTDDLHRRINSHAQAHSRSMNSEIVLALEAAYPAPVEPESVNDALLEAANAVLSDWSKTLSAIGQEPSSNPRVAALAAAIERAKALGGAS